MFDSKPLRFDGVASMTSADNLLAAARSEGRHGHEVSAADVLRESRRRK
jgi:hypothetical protein